MSVSKFFRGKWLRIGADRAGVADVTSVAKCKSPFGSDAKTGWWEGEWPRLVSASRPSFLWLRLWSDRAIVAGVTSVAKCNLLSIPVAKTPV